MGQASDLAAKLTRELWNDYKAIYQPIASNLLNNSLTFNNPSLVTDSIAQATSNVNNAYNASGTNRLTALSRYGIAPTEAQNASAERLNNLSRSKAVVNAANAIRTNLADRDRAILFGSLGISSLYGNDNSGD